MTEMGQYAVFDSCSNSDQRMSVGWRARRILYVYAGTDQPKNGFFGIFFGRRRRRLAVGAAWSTMEMTNATRGGGNDGHTTTNNDGSSSSFGQPAKRTTRKGGGGDMAMALNYVFLPDDQVVLKGM